MYAEICQLLRPPLIEAEQQRSRFAIHPSKRACISLNEWMGIWESTKQSPDMEWRSGILMHGAVSLRFWLGRCHLPLLVPATREAFEGSGFMRWYAALVAGIQALPPSDEREDAAQFLEQDVLPLLMRIDPCAERKDLWRAARNELTAMRNCRS